MNTPPQKKGLPSRRTSPRHGPTLWRRNALLSILGGSTVTVLLASTLLTH